MILSFLWTEGVVGNVINISVLSAIEGGKLQFNICAVFAQTLSEMSFISCEDIFWSKFTKFIQTYLFSALFVAIVQSMTLGFGTYMRRPFGPVLMRTLLAQK
jgi:hypothetical protein